MSTMPAALERNTWLRPKYLLFAAVGLMLAYVIPHDESFLVHPKDPLWQHYEPFKWWLLPHGIAQKLNLKLEPQWGQGPSRILIFHFWITLRGAGRSEVRTIPGQFSEAIMNLQIKKYFLYSRAPNHIHSHYSLLSPPINSTSVFD